MTSWFTLSLFILLSVNTVLSAGENKYKDALIDNDPYLSRCIISTGTGNLKRDGVKKIYSGPECYAKTIIVFKVEPDGNEFLISQVQGNNLAKPAKIRYKFGDCYDIVIKIKEKNDGTIKYILHRQNNEDPVELGKEFFIVLKRNVSQDQSPDAIEVLTDATGNPVFSKPCKAFEKDLQDDEVPTLILFEQEILQGVPDLILVWSVIDYEKRYFGTAYAKKIIDVGTTTLPTTTTKPTTSTSTVTSTTTETSTIAPTTVNSNSSLSTTDSPKLDEMSNWWFISVIIVEFVIILLLVLALIVACLVIRRLTHEIALFDADMKSTANRFQSQR